MKIYLSTLTGKKVTVEIEGSDTLFDLKCKVQDMEGISPDQQELNFGGVRIVGDGLVLDQINAIQTRLSPNEPISESSYINLHLILRLRGGGNEIHHRPVWIDSDSDDELPRNGPFESAASNGVYATGQKQVTSETRVHSLPTLDCYSGVKELPDSLKKNLKKGIHGDDADLSKRTESTSIIRPKNGHNFWMFLSKAGTFLGFVILVITAAALVPKSMRKDSKVGLEDVGRIAFTAILLMISIAFVLLVIRCCRPSLMFQSLKGKKYAFRVH